ncbi:kinase-like protein [Periconia macrospinosa]|uniref:Kinase-like protein n=1 Tax=Periconia macrospinosa TaxID=97972 RepID=A0A2V1DN03_9PLEO|nr:kinase-like protein [Periconia macrospinosa]
MSAKLQDDPDFIHNFKEFLGSSKKIRVLGEGADGVVTLYRHVPTSRFVAVKSISSTVKPRWKQTAMYNLKQEIKILDFLGMHPHIIKAVGWDIDILALALEYADQGTLYYYKRRVNSYVKKFPEVTMWKILLDVSQGISFLHQELGESVQLLHGDIKPDNFLVVGPRDVPGVPLIPTFKFADFGRMRVFDPKKPIPYMGTPEYAPPQEERKRGVTPAVDIWSIGSTLSEMAFTIMPNETDEQYIARHAKDPDAAPAGVEVTKFNLKTNQKVRDKVRFLKEALVRPLNASIEEQIRMGIPKDNVVEPYSDELQQWYQLCCTYNPEDRIQAEQLQNFLVPTATANVDVWARKWDLQYSENRKSIILHNARARSDHEFKTVPPQKSILTTDLGVAQKQPQQPQQPFSFDEGMEHLSIKNNKDDQEKAYSNG